MNNETNDMTSELRGDMTGKQRTSPTAVIGATRPHTTTTSGLSFETSGEAQLVIEVVTMEKLMNVAPS